MKIRVSLSFSLFLECRMECTALMTDKKFGLNDIAISLLSFWF